MGWIRGCRTGSETEEHELSTKCYLRGESPCVDREGRKDVRDDSIEESYRTEVSTSFELSMVYCCWVRGILDFQNECVGAAAAKARPLSFV